MRAPSIFVLTMLLLPVRVHAQDSEPSLGEVAREARKAKAGEGETGSQKVIDNDNFSVVLDQAEAARLTGKPVFSIDTSGNAFRMTSPDGTCSLSFDAKATALISSSYVSSDLPQDDLAKLEAHATIHDDVVEVFVHNSSAWEVRELIVGITVLQKRVTAESDIGLGETSMATDPSWTGKPPDSTSIVHLRGSVAGNATGTFTAVLSADSTVSITGNSDWHWALVSARGIPAANSPAAQSTASSGVEGIPTQVPVSPATANLEAGTPPVQGR